MQEFTEAGGAPRSAASTVEHLIGNAARAPRSTAIRRQRFGRWEKVTFEQFHDDVRQLGKGLAAAGIQPGDRIAILSPNRYEWMLADYAIWYAGAVSVPVDESCSCEDAERILTDSGAVAVFLGDGRQRDRLDHVIRSLPDIRVWLFDDDAVDRLQDAGLVVGDDDLDARRATLTPDSTATIVYTSATTGEPRGCVITHGSLAFAAESLCRAMPQLLNPSACVLALLPACDMFARAFHLACLYAGAPLGHSTDPDDLAGLQPTVLLAAPADYERIYAAAALRESGSGRGRLLELAAGTAVEYSRRLDSGGPGVALRTRHALFERLVYAGLRAQLGGRLAYGVSPGGRLGERIGHLYRGIGVSILECYGLCQTSGATTANRPGAARIGTVGRPIPGSSVCIAETGEVLVRGANVFTGYWNDRAATLRTFTADGWLRTGDLGEIDDSGFLRLRGRAADLIRTAAGRTVAPGPMETALCEHPLIAATMVVGEGRPYLAALLSIDRQALDAWLSARGRDPASAAEIVDDPELNASLAEAIDHANQAVPKADSIRRFAIVDQAWSKSGGQLTASHTLRRDAVMRECAEQIDALYA